MKLQQTVTASSPLLPFLFTAFPEAKKTKVRHWLKYGSVHVNGRSITKHDHALSAGDLITIQPQKKPAAESSTLPPGLRIVHEDAHLLVVEKPSGWLTIAKDSGKGRNIYSVLMDHVRSVNPRLKVWIVHRLDRETSGLIVFAKTEEAKRSLQKDWKEYNKRYIAITEGVPAKENGTIRSHLDESNPMRVYSAAKSEDTREAITHYRVLRHGQGRALLELTLETGRRHQIRVQLSDARCPVLGDVRYGAKSNPAERLVLHASHLSFTHPEDGRKMTFDSPLPRDLAKLV
jgi:23S rRNA pseudouridine1911/1915/1917 synthase